MRMDNSRMLSIMGEQEHACGDLVESRFKLSVRFEHDL